MRAVQHVTGHVTGNVHRVFGGTERGRVGQLQFTQVLHVQPGVNGGGNHVHPFVGAVGTHGLGPVNAAIGRVQQLQAELFGPRVVRRMRAAVGDGGAVRQAIGLQLCFVQAGTGGGQIEGFQDGCAQRAFVALQRCTGRGQHVVGCHATLAVGGPGQCDQRRLATDGLRHFHRVTHGVNVGIGCLQVLVHFDAAGDAQLQPGRAGKRGFGPHADGQHHDVGLQALAAGQKHHRVVGLVFKVFDLVGQVQLDVLVFHVRVHDGGHFVVKRGQDVRRTFHQRGEQPALVKVFGHFNADVAATNHHRPPGLGAGQVAHDAVQIGDVAQRKHARRIDARQLGVYRFTSGRQQQLVVAFVDFFTGLQVAQAHSFGPAGNGDGLGEVAHVHPVACLEQRF